jgi:hypothetical protein
MRLKSLIFVMTIFVMTFLAVENGQCQETGVQLKDLIGIWKPDLPGDNVSEVIKFNDDGTYIIAYDVDKLATRPLDRGQIKLEGEQITFMPSESPACKTTIGKYTIKMTEKGNFQFTLQEDSCDGRRCLFGPELIRYMP